MLIWTVAEDIAFLFSSASIYFALVVAKRGWCLMVIEPFLGVLTVLPFWGRWKRLKRLSLNVRRWDGFGGVLEKDGAIR